jgi:hypothetical protein
MIIAIALWIAALNAPQPPDAQQMFPTPEAAVTALVDAARAGDLDKLVSLFGPDGRDLVASSDPATGKRNRQTFLAAVAEGWHLADRRPAGKELIVGNESWPFPIPLVQKGGAWRFDTAAGLEEVLARRIGRNELAAIKVCAVYVDAQRIYATRGHDGKPPGFYARRFNSEPGMENGLYWPPAPGKKRSPLGEMAAAAADDHATAVASRGRPTPFYGYYYRILDAQGAHAPGGEKSYVANDGLFRGFALVAWPAEYDVTGIMTFIVSDAGVAHEKDLGPDTAKLAAAITKYDPDSTWRKAVVE